MVGTILFTLGSLLCGFAWSDDSLIVARAIQGLGAATITPAALSILVAMFKEGRERNIALGAWGAVGGVGAAAGVLLGGVLTDLLSWEWIFFVNVPVGVAALVLTPFLLAESLDKHGQGFDIPGAVLVTSGLSLFVLGITQGQGWGWDSAQTIGVFVAAARPAPRVRRVGAAGEGSAGPVLDLPAADADGCEHRRLHPRDGAVRDVPDADAVHAAGARPVADRDRARLPRRGGHGDHLGERRRGGRHPGRRQARTRFRDGADDRRAPLLHAGVRRRLVLDGSLPGLPHHRPRDAVRVRGGHDRRRRRHEAAGVRPGVWSHQHVAADRRRGRYRDPLDDRCQHDERRGRHGNAGSGRFDRRLPGRVLGGSRDRVRRRARLGVPRPWTGPAARRTRPASSPRSSRPARSPTLREPATRRVPRAPDRVLGLRCGFARTPSWTRPR